MSKLGIEELIELLKDADPAKLSAITNALNSAPATHRHTNHVISTKTYTTVTKVCTCMLCGTVTTYVHNLEKGACLDCLDADGVNHPIRVTGKAGSIEVPCFTSKCGNCGYVIRSWTKEQLEENFMKLVSKCSFKEIGDYSKEVEE